MITWHDVLVVGAATLAVAVVGLALGALALAVVRHRSLRFAAVVVALTAVAVVGGVVTAVGVLMLVSGHALVVLVAAVVAGALAGLGVAGLLGRQVQRSSELLRERVRRIGSDPPENATPAETPAAAELAALAQELDQAQRALAESRRRHSALEASRRELVAWVSHDLRTPLADLRAMAEALEDGVVSDTDTVQAYHRAIRVEADRLAGMVEDLFELSRIQAGSLSLATDVVDLTAVAVAAVEPSLEQARRAAVTLSLDAPASASVVGDRRRLERAVRNLVANAVRHTRRGGEVAVSVASLGDGHVTMSVRDACGGIADADLPRVFDVGFRAEPARSPGADQGAGLGLAIAGGIVAAHEGTLTVSNDPPGCRFEIRLPAAPLRSVEARSGGPEVRAAPDSGSPPLRPA